jgi:hypothetical protein
MANALSTVYNKIQRHQLTVQGVRGMVGKATTFFIVTKMKYTE